MRGRPWQRHEIEAVRLVTRPRGPGRPRLGEDDLIVPVLAAALDRTPEAIRQQMKTLRGDDQGQMTLELRG